MAKSSLVTYKLGHGLLVTANASVVIAQSH